MPRSHLGIQRKGVKLLGGPAKAVAHKTQSTSQNPDALFKSTGYWPHFLLGPDVAFQFLPIDVGGYALKNARGGVETNRAGRRVVQVEIVGFSGETMHARTAERLIAVQKWLVSAGIPWAWPSGRPPVKGATDKRECADWNKDGWFGHSQVPENSHWDPAYTDLEWWVLNKGMEK